VVLGDRPGTVDARPPVAAQRSAARITGPAPLVVPPRVDEDGDRDDHEPHDGHR
jgi:hypothetical protein